MTKPKQKQAKKKKKDAAPSQPSGRLGAEQWLAVRQKSGAGPMEPKPRRGTRAERKRAELELESGAHEGNEL
jgi:Microvirus J protein